MVSEYSISQIKIDTKASSKTAHEMAKANTSKLLATSMTAITKMTNDTEKHPSTLPLMIKPSKLSGIWANKLNEGIIQKLIFASN